VSAQLLLLADVLGSPHGRFEPGEQVLVEVDHDPDFPELRRLRLDRLSLIESRPGRFGLRCRPVGPSATYTAMLADQATTEEWLASVERDLAVQEAVDQLYTQTPDQVFTRIDNLLATEALA
jgi:hypothetical protein